jgi:hypothetical protein
MNDPQPKPNTSDPSQAELAERLKQTRIPPELQDWVRQQFPQEDFLRELQEVQQHGGVSITDLLKEFDQTGCTEEPGTRGTA